MTRATEWTLDEATHNGIYAERVLPESGFHETTVQDHPRAIVLAGQPGAGKGGLAEAAKAEFGRDIKVIDLDEMREFHPHRKHLSKRHPWLPLGQKSGVIRV